MFSKIIIFLITMYTLNEVRGMDVIMNEKWKNILIIILSIIVVGLVCFIILFFTGVGKTNVHDDKNTSNNDKNELNVKLNENMDYVYDANYSYGNKYTEYVRGIESDEDRIEIRNKNAIAIEYTIGKQFLKNLKVPYININSEDAKRVNEELKELYMKNAEQFDKCALDIYGGCTQILTYKSYEYNDIVSIVIVEGIQINSPVSYRYKTYNFDIKTGSLIDYSSLVKKLGYDYNEILNKIKNNIKVKMDELYLNIDLSNNCKSATKYNSSNCYEIAYKLLDESISSNSMLFVDNDGFINILAIPYSEAGQNSGSTYYLFKVEK